MRWNLTEACAGGGALTLSYLGAKGQIVPYQGSKWRLRHELTSVISERGFSPDDLHSAHLVDAGPWGDSWNTIATGRWWVVEELLGMLVVDPRKMYDTLHLNECSDSRVARTAEHLYLSRLAFSGKAISDDGGIWKSAGFNKSSAYGVEGTDKFGPVRPMIPALIDRLEEDWRPLYLHGERACAMSVTYRTGPRSVVYIDPPYPGTTAYPGVSFGESEVVDLAITRSKDCGLVVVSGLEPIGGLIARGWSYRCLRGPSSHTARFRSKSPEYITISPQQSIS